MQELTTRSHIRVLYICPLLLPVDCHPDYGLKLPLCRKYQILVHWRDSYCREGGRKEEEEEEKEKG